MAKINEVTLDEAMELAKKHHQSGNLTMADRVYRDIVKSHPKNYLCFHYLGIIAYQRGAHDEGVGFLSQAVSLNKDNPETWNAYGVMLELTGEVDEAINAWEKALEIRAEYPDALSNYANACYKKEDFEKAKELCERAITFDPNYGSAYINLGNALGALKELQAAIDAWEKSLELIPNNLNAFVNIGNALRDLGRINESEEYCRKAVEISPESPEALVNLGNAMSDQGHHQEAADLFKKATDIRPNFAKAHSNLALSYMDLLRYDDAIIAARYAIAFDPNYSPAYGYTSNVLREQGKLDEAESFARKALSLDQKSTQAKLDLAEVLFLKDNFVEAATLFEEAQETMPDSSSLYLKLGSALEKANRNEEAIKAMEKAAEIDPEMPEIYHVLGATYLSMNDMDKALETLEKGLKFKPDYVEALATKSEVLQSMGDMEQAKIYAEKAIAINKDIPSTYLTLSKVKKFKDKDDENLKKMESLIENTDKYGRMQSSALHYALFKAYEDIKDYDASFVNLEKGATFKRESVIYDPQAQTDLFKSIMKKNSREFLDTFDLEKSCQSDVPIFIVGMPRSGTTLTEQIISSHPDVFGAGELYNLGQAEENVGVMDPTNTKEFGQAYVDSVQALHPEAASAKRITDKMPGNYVRMANIYAALPNAKIIHCRRNPIDTCLSCYKQLFGRGHYWSYTQEELARHYKEYDEMMDHWREIMPNRFLEIRYEDTINDFENQARMLIDYVGLEWDDACLTPHKSKRSVLTASKGQVRKPIYKTSIEAWRRYEEQLQPMAYELEPYVEKVKKS